jgi:hypothetical protein
MQRVKEGECDRGTFYTCTNVEHWNLLKSFSEGEWGRRENKGGDEPKWDIIYIFTEMSDKYHMLIKCCLKRIFINTQRAPGWLPAHLKFVLTPSRQRLLLWLFGFVLTTYEGKHLKITLLKYFSSVSSFNYQWPLLLFLVSQWKKLKDKEIFLNWIKIVLNS